MQHSHAAHSKKRLLKVQSLRNIHMQHLVRKGYE